ncbi:putative leader peptide [Streptacidiphilus neutrinimicus]
MQRSPQLVSRGHIDLMRVASAACHACRPSR